MNSKYIELESNIVSELAPGQRLSFDASQPASLFTTTSFLYTTAIMLIVGVAATRYMLAGIWRIEASERGVRKSNEEIKRVTLGLLGVLSLFVILYTFNKDLLTGEVGLAGLKSTAGALPVTSVPRGTSTSPVTNGTEQANWSALTSAGIRIVSTTGQTMPCTEEQLRQPRPTCVSLVDIPQSVITMLVELKSLCPGNMQVTGGTEPGHRTHGRNRAAVDVDDNDSSLNSCIRSFPRGPNVGSWCTATFVRSGFVFCDETGTSHWHIYK
jgi:hypothetical protein